MAAAWGYDTHLWQHTLVGMTFTVGIMLTRCNSLTTSCRNQLHDCTDVYEVLQWYVGSGLPPGGARLSRRHFLFVAPAAVASRVVQGWQVLTRSWYPGTPLDRTCGSHPCVCCRCVGCTSMTSCWTFTGGCVQRQGRRTL